MFTLILTANQMALILKALKQEHDAAAKLSIFLPDSEWPARTYEVLKLITVLENGIG